jgi:hypothetical protein
MFKSIKSEKVQRDNRTSLGFKKFYLWISLITCIFGVLVSCFMFYLYSNFTQNNAAGVFFIILSILLLLLSLVLIVINLIAIFQTDFMWLTTRLSGGQCVGRDILDCNPDEFDKFEDKLKDSNQTHLNNFNEIYLSTLHPDFSPNF